MFSFESASALLNAEFESRKTINPRYSLRGFARYLGISPSKLSEMMTGRQGLSVEKAGAIADRLNLSKPEKEAFCDMAALLSARSFAQRDAARVRLDGLRRSRSHQSVTALSRAEFCEISDWFYFAVFEMLDLKIDSPTPKKIARALGISTKQAKEALCKLEKSGLIRLLNGAYQRTKRNPSASFGSPSTAIRRMTAQLLAKASQAIYEQGIDERHVSTLTVAIDRKHLPHVFQKIDSFRRELNLWITEANKDSGADAVYCFSTQFFKLTKTEDRSC